MAMTSGKYFLQQSNWPYNTSSKTVTYHLFHHHGDAFSILYSEIPQNLTVNHLPVFFVGMPQFAVTANEDAVIALTVDGEIVGVAEATGAPVNIDMPALVPGDTVKVTITKANYYRYVADVPVVSSTYPYVLYAGDIIDDSNAGNNDGILNPGETIEYGVYGKNVGTGTAQGVYGMLSHSDPYVTVNVDSSWFGNIAQGDSNLSNPYYDFTIAGSCPDGHEILFDLEFHDTNDSVFTSDMLLTVYGPTMVYHDVEVINGNGIWDPGETVDLVITISNDGSVAAQNVTSTLITDSPFVTIIDNSASFGTVQPGATVSNTSDHYTASAPANIPQGTEVEFGAILESGYLCDTLEFIVTVGQFVPSDTGLYYAYYSSGSHTFAPDFDWIAIDTTQTANPGTSLDPNNDETVQISLPFTFQYYGVNYNQISISSNGWIAMGTETSIDYSNSAIPNSDGPSAMIAGLWDDLDPGNSGQPSDVYYYYDAADHLFIVEYFRVEHWPSGSHETFEIILRDPAYYPTPTGDGEILVQYLVAMQQTDNTLGIENASETIGIQYFLDNVYDSLALPVTDEFAILYTTYPPGYVGVEDYAKLTTVPVQTMLNAIHPNPFANDLRISYQISSQSQASITVYDALGRAVCGLVDGVQDPGYYTVQWSGLDDQGRKVPAGVYFIKFSADNYQNVQKTVLLK